MARRLAVLAAMGLLAWLVVEAAATQNEMDKLPLSQPYGCANCHSGATATTAPGGVLNAFGQAFLANGKVWDATLASQDSDGDGCQNGSEIGDADGNGTPDGHITQESSNPGVDGDCTARLVDEASWGEVKALFDTR